MKCVFQHMTYLAMLSNAKGRCFLLRESVQWPKNVASTLQGTQKSSKIFFDVQSRFEKKLGVNDA